MSYMYLGETADIGSETGKLCCTIADKVVPRYRDRSKPALSCSGDFASRWGAAYHGAALALAGARLPMTTGVRASENGYVMAFYKLTGLMGIGARTKAPMHVWREEMLPRLATALRASQPRGQAGMVDIKATWREPVLTERKYDDDCDCLEELWEAFGGILSVHLAAGKPSNGHFYAGDDGEAEIVLTAPTADMARAALFGWASAYYSSAPQTSTGR